MSETAVITDFGYLLLFLTGGAVFVAIALFAAFLIRPSRPNEEKLTTYECGEDPAGNAWSQFNVRFYIIALIFVLFDVEIVFLFPWATVFGQEEPIAATNGLWGWFSLVEVLIFVLILSAGLAYAWRKGFLDWVRPETRASSFKSPVPPALYEAVNNRYRQKPAAKPKETPVEKS